MSRPIEVADHDAGLSAKIAFFFTKRKLAADGWSGNCQHDTIAADYTQYISSLLNA